LTEQETLIVVGIGYLAALAIWALSLQARARTMLRVLSEIVDPEVWQALGAPESLKDAMKDPDRRWHKFLRSGEYRRQCDDVAVALIDDFRRRTYVMLAVCVIGGLLLIIRFWPLFVSGFPG
jgi:hypothetical protein